MEILSGNKSLLTFENTSRTRVYKAANNSTQSPSTYHALVSSRWRIKNVKPSPGSATNDIIIIYNVIKTLRKGAEFHRLSEFNSVNLNKLRIYQHSFITSDVAKPRKCIFNGFWKTTVFHAFHLICDFTDKSKTFPNKYNPL